MTNRLIKILFIVAVGLLLLKSGVNAAIFLWPKNAPDNAGNSAANELIQLTNTYRRGLGLTELAINPRLTQAAVNKAKNLLAEQYFSHTSPAGKKFSDWVREVNYAYFYVGENLAIDFNNPQEVFEAWLESPKHKENIERKEFQEIGIADLKGRFEGRETEVVVQLFGSRVLGANEQSTATDSRSATATNDYFNPLTDISVFLKSIDRPLGLLLFAVILLLIAAVFCRRIKQKKPPPIKAVAVKKTQRANKISAKQSAPPLVSLYTKRTLTGNGNSNISARISPPDSRKSAPTKNRRPTGAN